MEDCAAWDFHIGSRLRIRDFYKSKKGVKRQAVRCNDHCTVQYSAYHLGLGLTTREGYTKMLWEKMDENTMLVAYEPCEPTAAFDHKEQGWVTAKFTTLLRFERLPPVGDVAQTRVSFRVHTNLGGLIPPKFVNAQGIGLLMHVSRMRLKFDKSAEIDAASRTRIVNVIQNHADEYSEEEDGAIKDGMGYFAMFEDENSKELALEFRSTFAKIAYKEGDNCAWGWASATVRATPEEIMSNIWDIFKRAGRYADDLEKAVDEAPNEHNKLIYVKKLTPSVLDNRDFYGRSIWKKASEGTFVIVTTSEEGGRRPHLPRVIRGKYPSVMRITKLNDQETKIEYVIHPDFGGSVPSWAMNLYIGSNLSYVYEIREKFQALRGLEQWDEGDGKAVGEIVVIKTKEETHRQKGETKVGARMRVMFEKYRGLKEVSAKYEFVEGLLARMVQNKLRPARDVSTRLCNVSKKEGRTIGSGLAMSLASNLTAEAAVDEWIGKYPALQEIDREEVWFRPMVNIVALRLLGEVSWGLKTRVFLGAGLSVLDMASDINVIVLYSNNSDQEEYAMLLVGMIAACVGLQLIATLVQYHKKPLARLVGELLIVLTGLKPG
jgi:hypothetical protein